MDIFLPDYAATNELGQIAAGVIANASRPLPIFFYGDLGAGKTTLISALVKALPGGGEAETSSPSFTVCNMYATTPPVAHFDAYRQENGTADESLLDFLDGKRHLVLVEWAERLPDYALPPERISCEMAARDQGRFVRFAAYGARAENFLAELGAVLRSHAVFHGQTR